MRSLKHACLGARVLVALNADLLLFAATLGAAMVAAGYLGTL